MLHIYSKTWKTLVMYKHKPNYTTQTKHIEKDSTEVYSITKTEIKEDSSGH